MLHSINSLLTLFIYNLVLGPKGQKISFYAAALFAVHPIHTEAVKNSYIYYHLFILKCIIF